MFSNILNKIMPKLSLRFILIFPFIFLMLVLAGIIGWRSFITGTHAVTELSNTVLKEMTSEGEIAITDYLKDMDLVLNAFSPEVKGGPSAGFNYGSNEAIEQRFWELTTISDAVTYVYIGRPNGDYIGVDREGSKGIAIKIKDDTYKERTTFIATQPGDRSKFKSEDKGYNPVTRPWYRAAVENGKNSWAPLFVSWSRNVLMITRSKPVKDASGNFYGVVTTDRPLDKLSEFLEKLKKRNLSNRAAVFIMEANGDLIASTSDPKPYIKGKIKDSFTRIKGNESKSQIIRDTYKNVMKNIQNQKSDSVLTSFFDIPDDRIHYSLKTIKGLDGLGWIMVVAAPESDFTANVIAEAKTTFIYSVITLILAVIIGLLILKWVTNDLEELTLAVENFGQGEDVGEMPLHRNDEIGVLANSFNKMAIEIEQQRVELKRYNAELEQRVEERTKELALKNRKLEEEIRVRKMAQEKILQLFNIVELTDDAIMVCDINKNVQYLNPAFIRITGYSLRDMKSNEMSLLKSGRYDPIYYDKSIFEGIAKKLHDGRTFRGVLRAKKKNAEVYHSEVTITPVLNEEGELIAYTSVERDVTLNEKAQEDLMLKLHYDRLTGLITREALTNEIEKNILSGEEVERRRKLRQGLAVLCINIDDFKKINETYQHEIGDQILVKLSTIIKGLLRENDYLSRLAGDDFLVVLPTIGDREAALKVAAKIEEAFKVAIQINEHTIKVNISIGTSLFQEDGIDFETLIRVADDRMYEMKKQHKQKKAS